MKDHIRNVVRDSISVKQAILQDEKLLATVDAVVMTCVHCFRQKGKILFAGNGGSAADAQHLAAELSGRFYLDREPLFAEALHVNTSYLTAVANDYEYDEIYARLVRAMGQAGDILFALSTSGNSRNVVRAVQAAKNLGMTVVAMTNAEGGQLKPLADHLINIPSKTTPRVQEGHMVLGHAICERIEEILFGKEASE